MPLLVLVITMLRLLMIAPCIINCLTHFVSAQVNKLQQAVPVQQRYTKLKLTIENITHPQMYTAVRTMRLETSNWGAPNAPHHPISAGSSQKDLEAPIAKELGLPSLEGRMLGSQNRKKESRMAVAKRQGRPRGRRKKHIKRGAKIGPLTSLLSASFRSACPHAWRMYFLLLSE